MVWIASYCNDFAEVFVTIVASGSSSFLASLCVRSLRGNAHGSVH